MYKNQTETLTWIQRCHELEELGESFKKENKHRSGSKKAGKRGSLKTVLKKKAAAVLKLGRLPFAGRKAPESTDSAGPGSSDRWESYFSTRKIVVYSALFGSYDLIREPLLQPDNIEYRLITDQPLPPFSRWQRIDPDTLADLPEGSASLKNRWCKLHPHLLFPDCEESIYLDANLLAVSDLTPLTAGLEAHPVCMFLHKKRDCVYQEIQACIDQEKAPVQKLLLQEKQFRSLGVPEHWGLFEAPVISRRHLDPACIRLMDAWWEDLSKTSGRDQISLIAALRSLDLTPSFIGVLGPNLHRCRLFLQLRHRSELTYLRGSDFDETH